MYGAGGRGGGKPTSGFSGFAITPKRTGPETQLAQMGYGLSSGPPVRGGGHSHGHGHGTSIGKRRIRSEEEYFEDDEDDKHGGHDDDLEYLPAPGSPSLDRKPPAAAASDNDSDDSDDPLEAFMAGVEKEVKSLEKKEKDTTRAEEKEKGTRDDIEEEDDQESYFRYMEEHPEAGLIKEEDEFWDYDEEGNPIIPDKKIIEPLPAIDHSEIEYEKFNKNFYVEHEEISSLSVGQVRDLYRNLGIRVTGILAPRPVTSFGHFGFDERLTKAIRKAGYTQPTPIQAQGVPIGLSGRDVVGIAKTGSGKTAAYLWPMLVHIMDQRELKPGDGPIGLIIAPTRELSQQIYQEARKFGKVYNINVVCAYGGGNMYEQCKACEEGAEIIVATPGRLIDLIKKKATNLRRVTYVVFDEADRMFDMGFEPQVRSIANNIRPDRQTMMFSATFRKHVERVARDVLTDPLRVIQGDAGEANEDVTQIVKVLTSEPNKWLWLTSNLVQLTTVGSVLIFVTRKANSEELTSNLKLKDFRVLLLHGDMNQVERNEVITSFKNREMPILVATDVAARGLDIPHIRTVINFDVARDIDTHTHRVGRTGRAGQKGTAYTLITSKDKEFAGHLVRNLEGANQTVPKELMDLALQNQWFKKTRFQQQKVKKLNTGGSGLGFKERPGLGSTGDALMLNSFNPNYALEHRTHSGKGQESSIATVQCARATSGPQSDRVSALKAAFANQFKSNFISASGPAPQPTSSMGGRIGPAAASSWTSSSTLDFIPNSAPSGPPNAPTGPPKSSSREQDAPRSKKRSRWDE